MREPVLIFDFGNVVGFFDYLRACERFAGGLGMTGPALRDLLVERGFPGCSRNSRAGGSRPRPSRRA